MITIKNNNKLKLLGPHYVVAIELFAVSLLTFNCHINPMRQVLSLSPFHR